MKHRNAAAKGVPHQPVVKYVVTNKGSVKHVTHLFEPRDGHTGGPAMPRQVEIKPGIIAERLADRLPLAAIARKSMQKTSRDNGLPACCAPARSQVAHLRQQTLQLLRTVSLVDDQFNQRCTGLSPRCSGLHPALPSFPVGGISG